MMTGMTVIKFQKGNKNINESDVCDRLPYDLKNLFKRAIRIEIDEEPDYDYIMDTLVYLRDKSLNSEGFQDK